MKVCRVCKEDKNLLSFAKDKRSGDKLQSECRQCRANRYAKSKQGNEELFAIVEPAKTKWYKNAEVLFLIFAVSYLAYLASMELTK